MFQLLIVMWVLHNGEVTEHHIRAEHGYISQQACIEAGTRATQQIVANVQEVTAIAAMCARSNRGETEA